MAYYYKIQALRAVIEDLIEKGNKKTNICYKIGYTSTSQLNNVLSGKSIMSTKAIQGLFKAYNVNPTYFFSGAGAMYINQIEPAPFMELTPSVEGYTITEKEVESIFQQLSRLHSYGFSIATILAGDDNDYIKGMNIGNSISEMHESIKAIDEDIKAALARGIIKPVEAAEQKMIVSESAEKWTEEIMNSCRKRILDRAMDDTEEKFYEEKHRRTVDDNNNVIHHDH
jgi:transcriptional regulator with XRE-family HTH domain